MAATPTSPTRALKTLSDISEYQVSKERFHYLCRKPDNDSPEPDDLFLMKEQEFSGKILKLCNNAKYPETDDMNYVFEMIIYSDYIQLKNEEIENFYLRLTEKYFLKKLNVDFTYHLKKLNPTPHVKLYLVEALLKSIEMVALQNEDKSMLILRENRRNMHRNLALWTFTLTNPTPDYVKLRLFTSCQQNGNDVIKFTCLNLVLRLLNVNKLHFDACNLIYEEYKETMYDLTLKKLCISNCCIYVNRLIRTFLPILTDNLTELRITDTIIDNDTLKMIRYIPLETLDLSNAYLLRKSVNGSAKLAQLDVPHFDYLWEDGCLRETLRSFHVFYEDIPETLLSSYWKSKVEHYNVRYSNFTESKTKRCPEFSSFGLSLVSNYIDARSFSPICNLRLETLEMRYFESLQDDLTPYDDCVLKTTLKKLILTLASTGPNIILFFAPVPLVSFSYHVERYLNECNLSVFMHDYAEQRKHLRMLSLQMHKCDMLGDFVIGLANLRLTKLCLSVPRPQECDEMRFIRYHLGSISRRKTIENVIILKRMRGTITDLHLRGATINDSDLGKFRNFERLQVLEFEFDQKLNEAPFKNFIDDMSSIDLRLWAFTNHSNLCFRMKRLIEIASHHCKGIRWI